MAAYHVLNCEKLQCHEKTFKVTMHKIQNDTNVLKELPVVLIMFKIYAADPYEICYPTWSVMMYGKYKKMVVWYVWFTPNLLVKYTQLFEWSSFS